MARRILFVDDEPMVLSGLKRSLYGMRHEWEMVFVSGGQEALQQMAQQSFDIIVTDMRMPAMNGAQLLEEVRLKFPQCLRFVLSGQADRDSILTTVSPTHQFLAKPCEASELKSRLTRALSIRNVLQNKDLRGLVSKLDSLPTLPTLFAEITKELNKPEPSVSRISQFISEDIALTAKILQLVNSAFFGIPRDISSASEAVGLLGLDIVRSLAISTHIFNKFKSNLLDQADMDYLWKHSLVTAGIAKNIAIHEKADRHLVDDCFTAGLLHDLGKLVLASSMADQYGEVLSLVRETQTTLVEAELKVLGCSHAEVAAYLLTLWGLPGNIVEGVAWHHSPSSSMQAGFSTVAAAHVASVYDETRNSYWMADGTSLDGEYLKKIGCENKEQQWRSLQQEPPSADKFAPVKKGAV